MDTRELEIINLAISKYRRIANFLKITHNRTLLKTIATDHSILRHSCEFGMWYYNDGQTYKHLKSFQDIDKPYSALFANYYELLELLSSKISILKKVMPFYKGLKSAKKEDVGAKLKMVSDNCLDLLMRLEIFEKELLEIHAKVKEAGVIVNQGSQTKIFKSATTKMDTLVNSISNGIKNETTPSLEKENISYLLDTALKEKVVLNSKFNIPLDIIEGISQPKKQLLNVPIIKLTNDEKTAPINKYLLSKLDPLTSSVEVQIEMTQEIHNEDIEHGEVKKSIAHKPVKQFEESENNSVDSKSLSELKQVSLEDCSEDSKSLLDFIRQTRSL